VEVTSETYAPNGEETDTELFELVKDERWLLDVDTRMRDSGSLKIKPHKKGFATYKDTFKGQ